MARAEPLRGARLAAHTAVAARAWWPVVQRILTVAFFGVVLALLYRHGQGVDWPAVRAALRALPGAMLVVAAGLAMASHALFASYDLVARHLLQHRLAARRVLAAAWVSYVFNLNLGALVGGVAVRYRLYARMGLDTATIAQVVGLGVLTNWIGYLVLAGPLFWFWQSALPAQWAMGEAGLRLLGLLLSAVGLAYLALCSFAQRRLWQLRGHRLELPSGRTAWLQLALSVANWAAMAAVVYVLLGQRIEYPTVLAVLMIAAVAGAMSHVPAGLGVLESVFVALLGTRLPAPELLAALLAYRAIYYLAPLLPVLALMGLLEARGTGGVPQRG